MKDIEQLLSAHPFFAGLGDELHEFFAGCGRNVHVNEGEYLFHTGEPAEHCYLVRHGRVALELVGPGGQRLVIDTVDAGGMVGQSWLVPPYEWYLDARAVAPTNLIELDAVCLREKCEADPRLGYLLLQRVAHTMYERMQAARLQLQDVYGARGGR
jgi:CRP-like cAMP-binding protein